MEIQTRSSGDARVLDLNGPLTLGQATMKLRNAVREASEKNPGRIVLNMQNVPFMDSCGVGELVSGHSHVQSQGGELVLLNLHKRTMEPLILTKLITVFDIFSDELSAISGFKQDTMHA